MPVHTRLTCVALVVVALSASAPHAQRASPADSPITVAIQGVVRRVSGEPIRGARIGVSTSRRTPPEVVITDEIGRYTLHFPLSTPYKLLISKPGYTSTTIDNPSGLRADAALDITLQPGAAVHGSVVDRFGDPMVNLSVSVVPTDVAREGEEHVAQTDERGNFRIGSLSDGAYNVQLSRAPIVFNRDTVTASIPQIESYQSTMAPTPFAIERHRDVDVNLVFDAGPNRVELGAVAVASFDRDRARGAQPPRDTVTGRGILEGWVIDSSGRIARGAIVDLQPVSDGTARRTSADAEGRYALTGLPDGRYVIWARRDGYTAGRYDDSMRSGAQVVNIRGGERLAVTLTMSRGSVISGVVVDRFGDPVEGAAVELQQAHYSSGRALLGAPRPPTVRMTDDLGHYTFADVEPGTYYVNARDEENQVFYPDRASVSQSSAITVEDGRDSLNVALQFQPQPLGRVTGRVIDATGAARRAQVVLVESARAGALVGERRTTQATNGSFAFAGVAPGAYVLQAIDRSLSSGASMDISGIAGNRGSIAYDVAHLEVTGRENTPAVMQVRPGIALSGNVRVSVPALATTLSSTFRLSVIGADPDDAPLDDAAAFDFTLSLYSVSHAVIQPDWRFVTEPVAGPFRLILINPPEGWWLKSAVVNGIDAARVPVTVTSDRAASNVDVIIDTDGATLSGRVVDERTAIAGATVVIFSVDPELWFRGSPHVRHVHAGRNGRFSQHSLPPGEYWVAADDAPGDPELNDWHSISALTSLAARATRVRLSAAQRRTIELSIAR